jgi:hypothetical protein
LIIWLHMNSNAWVRRRPRRETGDPVGMIRQLMVSVKNDMSPQAAGECLRVRSIVTLCLFGIAAVVALKYPLMDPEPVFLA